MTRPEQRNRCLAAVRQVIANAALAAAYLETLNAELEPAATEIIEAGVKLLREVESGAA